MKMLFTYKKNQGCNTCPEGYEPIPNGEGCIAQDIIDATPPTNPQNLVAKTHSFYGRDGVCLIHAPVYIDGTGSGYTRYHAATTNFWANYSGTYTEGVLNRAGVWSASTYNNQQVGFTKCFDVSATKTYYLGVSCDNFASMYIDGVLIFSQDIIAINSWIGTTGYYLWFLYPVNLTEGRHIIEAIGNNYDGPAAIGVELYDMDVPSLMNCESYIEIGAGLIFSSKDMIGQPVELGNLGVGYSCPEGYSLGKCDGQTIPQCYLIDYIECP